MTCVGKVTCALQNTYLVCGSKTTVASHGPGELWLAKDDAEDSPHHSLDTRLGHDFSRGLSITLLKTPVFLMELSEQFDMLRFLTQYFLWGVKCKVQTWVGCYWSFFFLQGGTWILNTTWQCHCAGCCHRHEPTFRPLMSREVFSWVWKHWSTTSRTHLDHSLLLFVSRRQYCVKCIKNRGINM